MRDADATTEAPRLELYADFVCPFSWLVQPVVAAAAAALDLPVRHHAFELRPLPVPQPDERYMRRLWEHGVRPIARAQGLDPAFPTVRTRTRKAHEAAIHGERHGRGEALRAALREAYFRDGRDIGRVDVLVELGEAVGLDPTGLKVALDIDLHADEVAADRARAETLGVTAAPGLVLCAGAHTATRIGWCTERDLRTWLEENLNTVRA